MKTTTTETATMTIVSCVASWEIPALPVRFGYPMSRCSAPTVPFCVDFGAPAASAAKAIGAVRCAR